MLGTTLGKIVMVFETFPYILLNLSVTSQLLHCHQPIPQATRASSSKRGKFPWNRVGCISKGGPREDTVLIQR